MPVLELLCVKRMFEKKRLGEAAGWGEPWELEQVVVSR